MEDKIKGKYIKFHEDSEADLLHHLESQENITRYIKYLIRMDMAMNSQDDKAVTLPDGKVRLETTVSKSLAEQAMTVYSKLGIDMNTAIKLFLMATIRENGLPFAVTLDKENQPEK